MTVLHALSSAKYAATQMYESLSSCPYVDLQINWAAKHVGNLNQRNPHKVTHTEIIILSLSAHVLNIFPSLILFFYGFHSKVTSIYSAC